MLFLVGSIAERLRDRRSWLLVYFGAGLLTEGVALYWEPVGVGNSIAYVGLAGGVLVLNRASAARRSSVPCARSA